METFLSVKTKLTYEDKEKIKKTIREALELLKLKGNPIKSGESVVIKVNIVGAFPPEKAACTNPIIVEATVDELIALGAKVTIVEDCYDSQAPIISGIAKVAEKANVSFINLHNTSYKSIEVNGTKYYYYDELLNADHLILLPKLKTHILTNYTGAIKLMYGAIVKSQRVSLHKYIDKIDFAKVIVDIFSIRKPTLAIMDGIVSMDGFGPSHGNPNCSGLLMVSNDAVILDFYASMIMKYIPMEIDMIRIAMERNLSLSAPEDIDIFGDSIIDINNEFNLIPILNGNMRQRYLKLIAGVPKILNEKCLLCGICIKSCPFEAITVDDEILNINYEKCKQCFCCTELCASEAIKLYPLGSMKK